MTTWHCMRWEEQPNGSLKLKTKAFPGKVDSITFPDTPFAELVFEAFGERIIEDAQDPRLTAIPDMTDAVELQP